MRPAVLAAVLILALGAGSASSRPNVPVNVKVMTRNVYLGADLTPLFSARNLNEVLARFPERPKVVEIKVPDIGMEEQLCALLDEHDQRERVLVGSFYERSLKRFRQACPGVATSAGPTSARLLVALNWIGLGGLVSPSYQALQIPERSGGLQVASGSLMRTAQQRGLAVQLWTINEQPAMRHLLDMGAHGLITDYPDRALQLLGRSTRISSLNDR